MGEADKHQRPVWVYVALVVALVVIVTFVVIHLTMGSPFAHGAS